LPVLNGERAALPAERLSGIFQGVPLGPFEDFLGRGDDGKLSHAIQDVETEADMIAMELLAPCEEVARSTRPGSARFTALERDFGLPRWAAEKWARFVSDLEPRTDPVILGIERALKKKL
jgi:hypothetical protein